MADIPAAITVVIRHPIIGRRIVIAIGAFDDALGIVHPHDAVGHVKKMFEFVAHQVAVRTALAVGKRLVDVTDENITRVRPNQALHFFNLAERFTKLIAMQTAEQRQIGLRHQAEPVAIFIDLALHRPLREPEEIHVAQFCQQDVIDQLIPILAKHTLLLVPHRVRPAQADFAPVEIKFPLRIGIFILGESSHSELLFARITNLAGGIQQFHLQLVKPRRRQIPEAGGGQFKRKPVLVHAGTGVLGNARLEFLVQIPMPAKFVGDRRKLVVAKQGGFEILPIQ